MTKLWKDKLILLTGVLALVACNGNSPFERESDPIKAYSSLKGDVPQEELSEEQREQQAIVKPFDIHVVSEDTKRLQFVAGEESRYEISARVYIDGAQAGLRIKDAPDGLELLEKDASQGLWEVVWTPPKNAVSITDDDAEIPLELELVVSGGSAADAAKINALETIAQYTIEVRKSKKDPFIVGSQEFDNINKVNEDVNVNFSVVVEDPAAFDDWSPQLMANYDPSSRVQDESVLFAGNAVIPNPNKSPEKVGESRWKTHWILNTPFLAAIYKDRKVNNKITVEFSMQAQSQVTDRTSAAWTKRLTVEFNPEPVAQTTEEAGGAQ